MKKLPIYALSAVCALSLAQGCNESSDEVVTPSSAAVVYSFSLTSNDKILKGLDSVYFSIDLVKAQIFNADSLPFGTKVSHLVPEIKMTDGIQSAMITYRTEAGTDSTYDFLTNSSDSIDFRFGPAKLRVVSPSGVFAREYTIKVNVHQVKSDSLVWSDPSFSPLPTNLSQVKAQHTTANTKGVYCLTTDGSAYSLAFSEDLNSDSWKVDDVTLPAGADVTSFNGVGDALYILDSTGALYISADGSSWTATGTKWYSIIGDCGGVLGGIALNDGAYTFEQYPAGVSIPVPAEMPVSGHSQPINYKAPMSVNQQCIVLGGRKANGELSNATWAFDGSVWVQISKAGMPEAMEGVTVVPFFAFFNKKVYQTTQYSILMAFGGKTSKGVNGTVYISNDLGLSWRKGDALVQLPDYVTPGAFAQGFVRNTTYYPNRATRPVEEWQCPYIYLFGGETAPGQLNDHVWRGTLNRLTFKPII